MTLFFTADQHFGHANILKYQDENRRDADGNRFLSIEHMGDFLVDRWNTAVQSDDDVVYCIGDFAFKLQSVKDILPFLNGKKILICGNHDPFWKDLARRGPLSRAAAIESALDAGFAEVHLQLRLDIPELGEALLCHFPYLPGNTMGLQKFDLRYLDNRPKAGNEAVLLHGHVHSKWLHRLEPGQPMMINVGVDQHLLRPISEQEVVNIYRETVQSQGFNKI